MIRRDVLGKRLFWAAALSISCSWGFSDRAANAQEVTADPATCLTGLIWDDGFFYHYQLSCCGDPPHFGVYTTTESQDANIVSCDELEDPRACRLPDYKYYFGSKRDQAMTPGGSCPAPEEQKSAERGADEEEEDCSDFYFASTGEAVRRRTTQRPYGKWDDEIRNVRAVVIKIEVSDPNHAAYEDLNDKEFVFVNREYPGEGSVNIAVQKLDDSDFRPYCKDEKGECVAFVAKLDESDGFAYCEAQATDGGASPIRRAGLRIDADLPGRLNARFHRYFYIVLRDVDGTWK